jgi:hypothetical protein
MNLKFVESLLEVEQIVSCKAINTILLFPSRCTRRNGSRMINSFPSISHPVGPEERNAPL